MIIVKSIVFGILSIIIGNIVGFILSLIIGLGLEPIAEKNLSEPTLRKFRHIWFYAWTGFTIGVINSSLIYFFKMNGWILLIIFVIYLAFFMERGNDDFVLHELCNGDLKQFNKLSRKRNSFTFLSFIIGLYGLWTIFIMWSGIGIGVPMPSSVWLQWFQK